MMENFNQVIMVENKGKTFQVKVIEEQLIVNTILRTDCTCHGCRVAEEKEIHQLGERVEDADSAREAKKINKVVLIDTNSVPHLAEVEHSQHVSIKIVEDPERDRLELQEHADSSNELSMVNETGPPPNINDNALEIGSMMNPVACKEQSRDSMKPLGNDQLQEKSACDTPVIESQGTGVMTPNIILRQ